MTDGPPSNPQQERFVLSCMMIDPGLCANIRRILSPADFFIERNGWVYKAICDLADQGHGIDVVTLGHALQKRGLLEQVGPGYLSEVASELPTSLHWATYTEEVRQLAVRRRIIAQAAQIVQQAHDGQVSLEHLVTTSRAAFQGVRWDSPDRPAMRLLSAGDILTTVWPEPVWAVPGLLPTGLGILAGRPKVGKSWLAMQLAQAVATGGHALGERIEPGAVLYLALEDSPQRLKDRLGRQAWPLNAMADFMPLGQFVDEVGDLRNGGGERLATQIERVGYRLVVIDTLSRSCYGDQNDVQAMTRALTPLQEMAHGRNCAILMVDHHRKGFGADPDAIGDILGSTAKGAMADTAWGLYRERGKGNARLQVTGRDIEERNLALTWDYLTGCWQLDGDADALEMTERRQEILDALMTLGRARMIDIAKSMGQDKSNTYRRLQDLVTVGLVLSERVGQEVYYRPKESF
ncbi:MAG: AAA family ATPase [Chloroflexota bacterium]